jgi:tetratricopeptide (TPR) repeat protein
MNTLSGLYDGIELLKRGLAMMEEAGGAEKGAVVETLGLLATAYRELGKQGEALAWGERCLAEAEAAWGSDGPGAIEAASGLALTCKKAGDLDRAVRLMERCLAALEGGGDAEGAGRIARNLGKALAKGGARFTERRQELSRKYP